MKLNKNLKVLNPYRSESISSQFKRCHMNESLNPILPAKKLCKDIHLNINYYPESVYEKLTESAKNFYKINSSYILPTNGSDEGLDVAMRTICNPKDNILILNPTFTMYKQYALSYGLNVIEEPLNPQNFNINFSSLISKIKFYKIKLLILPNPLTPSGNTTDFILIKKLVKQFPQTFFIIDEAYIEYSNEKSMLSLVKSNKNLLVTRTLSKFYGLAGIRLGFVFSHYTIELMKIKSPYSVNSMTAQVALNLFKFLPKNQIKQRKIDNQIKKEILLQWLKQFSEIECVFKSKTNFIFIKLNCKSDLFYNFLKKKYLIEIRKMTGKFENYCRITIL